MQKTEKLSLYKSKPEVYVKISEILSLKLNNFQKNIFKRKVNIKNIL